MDTYNDKVNNNSADILLIDGLQINNYSIDKNKAIILKSNDKVKISKFMLLNIVILLKKIKII